LASVEYEKLICTVKNSLIDVDNEKKGRIFDDTLLYAQPGSMVIGTDAYPNHWLPVQ
jgi:hypothetical protein